MAVLYVNLSAKLNAGNSSGFNDLAKEDDMMTFGRTRFRRDLRVDLGSRMAKPLTFYHVYLVSRVRKGKTRKEMKCKCCIYMPAK